MRKEMFLALVLIGGGEGLALAQGPSAAPAGLPCPSPAPALEAPAEEKRDRGWVDVDYLLWWMKPVCLKVPILTAGSSADAVPGGVGQPHTTLLLGASKFEFTGTSGVRPTIGYWLTPDPFLAIEAGGFWLAQATRTSSYHASGGPPTYIPFQTPDNTPSALPFSIPGAVNDAVTAVGSSQLWGAEANLSTHFSEIRGDWEFNGGLLVGCRYLELLDRVVVTDVQTLAVGPGSAAGAATFTTLNQFYGAQVGCRMGLTYGRWSIDYVTKLAAGETHLVAAVGGSPLASGAPLQPGLVPGPYLALASNNGQQGTYRVTVVPEVGLKVGCEVLENVRVTLGYTMLYWNRIRCPGDQMDPHVNVTELPNRGPATGPALPALNAANTDYFAQGLTAGVELRF